MMKMEFYFTVFTLKSKPLRVGNHLASGYFMSNLKVGISFLFCFFFLNFKNETIKNAYPRIAVLEFLNIKSTMNLKD